MKNTIEERFAMVPNELLNNSTISLKAKGLFAYIRSKPGGWRFSINRMTHQLKENRHAIRGAIRELEEHGYLIRRARKENGKWAGVKYRLVAHPLSENPTSENPFNYSKKDNSKKDIYYKRDTENQTILNSNPLLKRREKKEKKESPQEKKEAMPAQREVRAVEEVYYYFCTRGAEVSPKIKSNLQKLKDPYVAYQQYYTVSGFLKKHGNVEKAKKAIDTLINSDVEYFRDLEERR